MVWRINPKTQVREEISVAVGDIWKDDRKWKLRLQGGVITENRLNRIRLLQNRLTSGGTTHA